MARRVQHSDEHVASLDDLVVVQRLEGELDDPSGVLVQAVGRTHHPGEPAAAREVIGVHMGVNDMRDGGLHFLGLLDEPVLVARHHVDRYALAMPGAPEKVRKGRILGRKLFEEHGAALLEHQHLVRPLRPLGELVHGAALRATGELGGIYPTRIHAAAADPTYRCCVPRD